MATTWTYSDYVTYAYGTARLDRARLHLQELMNAKREYQSQSIGGTQASRFTYDEDIKAVRADIAEMEAALGAGATGSRSPFSIGRPRFF